MEQLEKPAPLKPSFGESAVGAQKDAVMFYVGIGAVLLFQCGPLLIQIIGIALEDLFNARGERTVFRGG